MVIVLMDLTVCSKRCPAVVFVVKFVTKDELTRAKSVRYPVGNRKVVEPHNNEM